MLKKAVLALVLLIPIARSEASHLVEMRAVDNEYLMITWADGKVHHLDDGKGPTAFSNQEQRDKDWVETFGSPLDTRAATTAFTYRLSSADDKAYRSPLSPVQCFRRAKVSGTAWGWPDPIVTLKHTVFLKLPHRLVQSKRYTLTIGAGTNSDKRASAFTFDAYRNVSEALHVNLIGYNPVHTSLQSADLYMWLGDGGARDYSPFVGREVQLVDLATGRRYDAGKVAYWKPSGPDAGKWNLTQSPVWTCDFSSLNLSGRFKLVLEGVGCSPEFRLGKEAYFEPFKTSLRGFYYMRIGEGRSMSPIPRQPRFIPGKDPANFKVVLTTYGPWHPDWKKAGGDQWDNKDWSKYAEPDNPTNPNAWGGHSDAADWDRHAGHISIIWDLLLPYVLTGGKSANDNLKIRESGNGLPDLLDEARYEVDFWLRLRDRQGGYSAGLNNPTQDLKTMYQAAAKPYMAWANAANAAMLADCFRIADKKQLMNRYRDASLEAWRVANDQDLDVFYGIGNGQTRGRDLKMMAAAFLYNVTGERRFEDAMAKESFVTSATSQTDQVGKGNQLWGTAAYLMCAQQNMRPIHYPNLLKNMRASVVAEAKLKNVASSKTRPSRRSTDEEYAWFQTTQEVQRVCVAHAISTDAQDKKAFMKAMILEADWGLGRNPMNMVQMTGLGSRHPQYVYTTGANDGVAGSHPGHTPYMNAEPWAQGFMFDPKYYARLGYPAWDKWPHAEALWNAPYCFANNEFTPQQTMRGKMCLYAYLYAIR
ncbi:MAG: glycoside hydrolase family 9 protein [Fimbriimonas sp.]